MIDDEYAGTCTLRTQKVTSFRRGPAPSWLSLIAQLAKQFTVITEVMGSDPLELLIKVVCITAIINRVSVLQKPIVGKQCLKCILFRWAS